MRPIVLLLLFMVPNWAAGQQKPEAQVQEKFAAGGFIRMHLSPGGYTISGGDANTILITYTASSAEELKRVKTKIRVGASTADLSVSDSPHNNFKATIEVPPRSDLRVRMMAGEIIIDGVEGSKDVEVDFGRIEVKIPKPQEYGHRDASVRAGSIEASAFDVSKGGLFRSFEQSGAGKYRLHAHVATGEINLRGPQ
jgi:hypothetical protein